jgi:hypothetical protein
MRRDVKSAIGSGHQFVVRSCVRFIGDLAGHRCCFVSMATKAGYASHYMTAQAPLREWQLRMITSAVGTTKDG